MDKKVEEKFGTQMLQKINAAVNQKVEKGAGKMYLMSNYNSVDAPQGAMEFKRTVNQLNEYKRVYFQRHKHSSFDNMSKELGQQYNFYLNRESISEPLFTHNHDIVPIENDW